MLGTTNIHRGISKDCAKSPATKLPPIPIPYTNEQRGTVRMPGFHRDKYRIKRVPVPYTMQQLKGIFQRFDTNRDGQLSKEELKDAFDSLGALFPGWRANRALSFADGNGDGYISEEELAELIKYAYELGYKIK